MDLLRILDGTPEPPIIDLHLARLNTSGVYHLATPMYDFQKELTDQIVLLHYPDVLKFCETDLATELVAQLLQTCILNCVLVSTHPYLLINHYMPKNLTQRDMLAKLAETSGKFGVLKDLMSVVIGCSGGGVAGGVDKHVAVVMDDRGRVFDLVEALLWGCSGAKVIRRYAGSSVKTGRGPGAPAAPPAAPPAAALRRSRNADDKLARRRKPKGTTTIHLVPATDAQVTRDRDALDTSAFDVVVLFDSTVATAAPLVARLRRQHRAAECALIRLVPMKTVEHVQMETEGGAPAPVDRPVSAAADAVLYRLVLAVVCLREQIGVLPPDLIPIYNQGLNYLGATYFEPMLAAPQAQQAQQAWPLPELPRLPQFSPADVERLLLTEVHYHYTPYDVAEGDEHAASVSAPGPPPTYYETKRLEQNYVTNPLKNDMHILSGIFPLGPADAEMELTHKLIMRMNTTYLEWQRVEAEHEQYVARAAAASAAAASGGGGDTARLVLDTRKTLSAITDDLGHAHARTHTAERLRALRAVDTARLAESARQLEAQVAQHTLALLKAQQYIANQRQTWRLQQQVEERLARLAAKRDEHTYTLTELRRAQRSVGECREQMAAARRHNAELERLLADAEARQHAASEEHQRQRAQLAAQVRRQRERGAQLRAKLGKSWRFLRHTLHLKKRKGRGATPTRQ